MIRRSVLYFGAYVVGAVALPAWSVYSFANDAPREDWALLIVLPLAWIFSYFPLTGSLIMAFKVRTLGATLERIADEVKSKGKAGSKDLDELEATLVTMAAHDNGLPEFVMRPFVRWIIKRMSTNAELAGSAQE